MGGKSAIGSLTIVGAVVVLLAQLAQAIGYTISEDDQAALVNLRATADDPQGGRSKT